MPRLSIVIPCLGGAAEFDGVLVSVLQNRPPDCEVIVVHGESYDDPYQLQGEVNFIHVPKSSPVELLNTALHQANGEIVHFVGCGLQTIDDWTAPALAHFHDPQVAAVAPVVLAVDRQTVLSAGVSWSSGGARFVIRDQRIIAPGTGRLRAKILGPTLTAAFYRRDVLLAMDGFDAAIGIDLADVNVALAIEALGRLHVSEPKSQLIHPSGHDPRQSSEFARSRDSERVFWRYRSRRNPALAVAMHPITCTLDTVQAKAPLFAVAGRLKALSEVGAVQKFQQRLELATQRLAELDTLRSKARKSRTAATRDDKEFTSRRRAA